MVWCPPSPTLVTAHVWACWQIAEIDCLGRHAKELLDWSKFSERKGLAKAHPRNDAALQVFDIEAFIHQLLCVFAASEAYCTAYTQQVDESSDVLHGYCTVALFAFHASV